MRAIFDPKISFEEDKAVLGPDHVHHLHNVVRIQPGEQVLILDGKGRKILTEVLLSSKKEIAVKKLNEFFEEDDRRVDLLLAPPKKDTFYEILRMAVELNIKTIQLADTHYSQRFPYNEEKVEKVLISSYEQSNSAYEVQIVESNSLQNLKDSLGEYDRILYFSTMVDDGHQEPVAPCSVQEKILVVVGPEGGFSPEEHSFFLSLKNTEEIRLKTNILRSQTAVPAALGYVHGKLLMPRS